MTRVPGNEHTSNTHLLPSSANRPVRSDEEIESELKAFEALSGRSSVIDDVGSVVDMYFRPPTSAEVHLGTTKMI